MNPEPSAEIYQLSTISYQPNAMNFRQIQIKKNLELRAQTIATVRKFFSNNNYFEVDTPVRIPAPAPEHHIDAESSGDWFLQTSPELCMKRLLAAGYERIYQICKCFRAKERGRKHLPEMTLLEWYTSGQDYHHMMNQCEALICFVIQELTGNDSLTYQGDVIGLAKPWPRLTVAQAFDRYGSMSVTEALVCNRFDDIMGLEIEPHLGLEQPVFLMDYPAECGALARLRPDNPHVVERFELYIGGLEMCNGFSELTDPVEQRQRFEDEIKCRRRDGKPLYPMPESFLEALDDMPESTGNALGMDRLVMLLADTREIEEVVAFSPEEL